MRYFLSLTALAIAGFLLRVANYSYVMGDDHVLFPAYDAYYHMRRIFWIIETFPNVPYFDPFINFPNGAAIIWPPLFDFSLAAVNILLGFGAEDVWRVETVCSFLIPIIGALTVFPVYLLAREIFDSRIAVISSALLVFTPVHIFYSRLGYVDHHTAVTFIETMMFYLYLKTLRLYEGENTSMPKLTYWTILCSLITMAGLFVWNGFIFYIAILDLFLLILMVRDFISGENSKLPLFVWISHISVALVSFPFVYRIINETDKPFTAVILSYFHLMAIAGFGVVGLIAHLARPDFFKGKRTFILLTFIGVGAGFLSVFGAASISEGLGWIFTTEPFMSMVTESKPILDAETIFKGIDFSGRWMTWFFFAFPAILALFILKNRNAILSDPCKTLLIIWSAALLLMTLLQRRFGEPFATAQAIVTAWFIVTLFVRMKETLSNKVIREPIARFISGALVCVMAALAYSTYYTNWMIKIYRSGLSTTFIDAGDYHLRATNSLRLLRGFTIQDKARANGVMSPLTIGHMVLYTAKTPVVANNFGTHIGADSFRDWSTFFLEKNEDQAIKILRKRKIRFVAVDFDIKTIGSAIQYLGEDMNDYLQRIIGASGRTVTIMKPNFIRSVYFRMTRNAGSESTVRKSGFRPVTVPALERFRLIIDSQTDTRPGDIKVYEFVTGARLLIKAPPDESFTIRYTFTTNMGRRRTYTASAVTDKKGHARLTLPYSSENRKFGHESLYEIEGAGMKKSVFVSEASVIEGKNVYLDINRIR